MVSASSDKLSVECDRIACKDELKRSVLLDINCQVDDTPEFTTADGYKTHLWHLNKRLKFNGRDAIYTACIIGQCLTELKTFIAEIKIFYYVPGKTCFQLVMYSLFIDLCNLATTYYRVSHISLSLQIVRSKFKLIKEIVREVEDFWMSGY